MSANRAHVKGQTRVKPVRRPRGSGLLTFVFTVVHPVLFGLVGSLKEQPIKAATRKHPYRPPGSGPPPPIAQSPPTERVNDAFIYALSQACYCCQHAPSTTSSALMVRAGDLYHPARRKTIYSVRSQIRQLHGASFTHRPRLRQSVLTREECLNMLDYYIEDYSTLAAWKAPVSSPPISTYSNGLQPSQSKSLPESILDSGKLALRPPVPKQPPNLQSIDRPEVQKLLSTLQDSHCTHTEAWHAYSALPSPGVAHLSQRSRRRLLQCLSIIERKTRESMFRFLSVVDDLNSIGQPLVESEWNSAIAFAAHGFERINAAGVESALLKWKEMERKADIRSGHVTFNILFDMATKAGKFVLAEMILREMERRGLSMNRHARVGLIYYYGLKGDGDHVRQAYRNFVEAGEIVDTVVMNCVIASLIRAGELSAAEQVYERMKHVLRQHTGRKIPHLHWREPRDLGRVLDRAAREYKDEPEKLQQIRQDQFLAPSQRTYAIFVEHHATKTGELRRIGSLLAEMQELGIPMDGRIFVKVFKGFAYNGGIRYTAWTKARLQSVRDSLFRVLDQRLDSVKLNRWLVIWVVRAFQKCCGPEQTLQIWEELRKRWKDDYSELAKTHDMLRDVLTEAVRHAAAAPTKMYI